MQPMTSDPAIAGESLTTLAARLPSSNPALANLSRPTQRRSYVSSSLGRRMTASEGQCKTGWPDTYDWAKIPYNVLGTMSNRIINEVRGINRVVCTTSPAIRQAPSSGSDEIGDRRLVAVGGYEYRCHGGVHPGVGRSKTWSALAFRSINSHASHNHNQIRLCKTPCPSRRQISLFTSKTYLNFEGVIFPSNINEWFRSSNQSIRN